ncbi:MAG: hypothetical protein M3Q07_28550 [Pseudobdellovibrionaceae bacterium]|nr:hypothetical protein [Pseudobdellovibrionaceae bacterium]
MQAFEVIIPEIDDISSVEASSARRTVFIRLSELDESALEEFDEIEVVVCNEPGMKSEFRVRPERIYRYCLQKVG